MAWYKEIDYKKFLTGDLKILEELIGIDKLIELIEIFGKTTIYISEKPVYAMKVEYIKKNYGKMTEKELARLLKVSERLVYKIGSMKVNPEHNYKLFEDEDGQ